MSAAWSGVFDELGNMASKVNHSINMQNPFKVVTGKVFHFFRQHSGGFIHLPGIRSSHGLR